MKSQVWYQRKINCASEIIDDIAIKAAEMDHPKTIYFSEAHHFDSFHDFLLD
jgi:hypothetical protein